MKRVFLRFPSRHIRKRNFIILMLLILLLCFARLEVSKGADSHFHPIVKESLKMFRDSEHINLQKLENVSINKLSTGANSSLLNDTMTSVTLMPELSTTTQPARTTPQSLIKQLLSIKNYQKICGNEKSAPVDIKADEDLFKRNSNVECSKKSFVLFIVLSHISSYESREKIRQSWGSIRQLQNKKLTVLFFVYSEKTISSKEMRAIDKERSEYLDTVLLTEKQGIRNDVNMYLKAFQFVVFGCNAPEYFVFVNDAMFVNIPTLLEALLTHKDISKPGSQTRSLFLCKVKKNVIAMRNKKSPWYVTNKEWPGKHYPPFCDLPLGMVISYEILRDMLMCSFYIDRLWITDVFVTGILPQKIEMTIEDFLEDFSTNSMKNHYIQGDMTHNVFLTEGRGYNDHTWRLIFNRSLREL